jgi:hypothetical protein
MAKSLETYESRLKSTETHERLLLPIAWEKPSESVAITRHSVLFNEFSVALTPQEAKSVPMTTTQAKIMRM